MSEITLQVNSREVGKSGSRKLRATEWTPAVIYGRDLESTPIAIEQKLIAKYQKVLSQNPIFVLTSDDKKLNGLNALMREVTVHPVNRKPVHVDLVAIAANQTITVSVTIELLGTPKGVKAEGGNLSFINHTVEVECLPKSIPQKIQYDITDLGLDEAVHVSDLKVPEGVTIVTPADVTICNIHTIKEEEATPAVAVSPADVPSATGTPDAAAAAPAAGAKTDKK
ncbi:MAG: 50S ribosomal protein L25 [Bdellovibrionales bacterium]|nr:50S ribosomal protein L25 [Bdellovibrionales bacterium]